jgi:hypothetical protein
MSRPARTPAETRQRRLFLVFIGLALLIACGRILTARSRDGHTPFFSANDRSRWCTISALVDEGTYAIDNVRARKGWNTIDLVRHADASGQLRYYSSKPPLLATLLAPQYWLIRQVTGCTFAEHPFLVARTILLVTHVPLLLLYFGLLWGEIDRLGGTPFGRSFTMAAAAFGTFLTTFANTLNNHLFAAVCVLLAWSCLARVERDRGAPGWVHGVCGLAAAFAVTCELPALSYLAVVSAWLLWRTPRPTLTRFAPAALLVAVAFFGTNYLAHGSLRPPYAHREDGNNWYNYPGSYWIENRKGVDLGEPSRLRYLFHCTWGHHGFFSLTPLWLLGAWGGWRWLRDADRLRRFLAALACGLLTLCVGFYVFQRPLIDRNYGGITSGLRWLFWLIPLWTLQLLPAVDRLAASRSGRALALVLLAVSAFSAHYGLNNPWVHPWLYTLVGGR